MGNDLKTGSSVRQSALSHRKLRLCRDKKVKRKSESVRPVDSKGK